MVLFLQPKITPPTSFLAKFLAIVELLLGLGGFSSFSVHEALCEVSLKEFILSKYRQPQPLASAPSM